MRELLHRQKLLLDSTDNGTTEVPESPRRMTSTSLMDGTVSAWDWEPIEQTLAAEVRHYLFVTTLCSVLASLPLN